MARNFDGKKYVVSGAGGGIGRAIAENLAVKGAIVFATACSKGVNDLEKSVPNIVAFNQDLSNWDETAENVDKLGDIDGQVNCAGILIPQMAVDITKEILYGHYDINLNAPIILMQVVGTKMIADVNDGSIVNISSCSSKGASKGMLAYRVSKDTSRQRSGKGAIRKRFPLQKPRWEKTKLDRTWQQKSSHLN